MLSTPPAFILSQDQTLMLKFVIFRCPVQFFNWLINFHLHVHWSTVLRLFLLKKRSCAVITAPWNSLNLSRLFHYLIIKVLFVCCCFVQATAYLLYHFQTHLSTTFLFYFCCLLFDLSFSSQLDYNTSLCKICQQIFWYFFIFIDIGFFLTSIAHIRLK